MNRGEKAGHPIFNISVLFQTPFANKIIRELKNYFFKETRFHLFYFSEVVGVFGSIVYSTFMKCCFYWGWTKYGSSSDTQIVVHDIWATC